MCRSLGRRDKSKALVVLPYVSIVREKTTDLAKKLGPAGIAVSGYYGAVGGTKGLPADVDVAVCTIEKVSQPMGKGAVEIPAADQHLSNDHPTPCSHLSPTPHRRTCSATTCCETGVWTSCPALSSTNST